MDKHKDKTKQNVKQNRNPYIVILILLALGFFVYSLLPNSVQQNNQSTEGVLSNTMQVHYIDVGQGDCILVQDGIYNILIDTGSSKQSQSVLDFLHLHEVDSLDMVILTHPHEDHIGSFDEIVEEFDVDTVLKSPVVADTSIYRNLEEILLKENIETIIPLYGEVFVYGDMVYTVLSDSSIVYEEVNDHSLVLRLDHLGNVFLFTGDMESKAEKSILEKKADIECDVLKIAHHGGSTSTTANFLFKASPIYAIIQCGKNNQYGHPHKTVLSRLDIHSVIVYRNDILGSITCISSNNGVYFKFESRVTQNAH